MAKNDAVQQVFLSAMFSRLDIFLDSHLTPRSSAHKLDHATSEITGDAIIAKMQQHKKLVHTITSDNGKEFTGHQRVAKKLDTGFYFAKPYHAWERGLNENTNGLVRQYIPMGSSFAKVTNEDIERVQNLLNSRPQKALGFQSPNEVFFAIKSPPPSG